MYSPLNTISFCLHTDDKDSHSKVRPHRVGGVVYKRQRKNTDIICNVLFYEVLDTRPLTKLRERMYEAAVRYLEHIMNFLVDKPMWTKYLELPFLTYMSRPFLKLNTTSFLHIKLP
jgi:UDP-3-O-acyl-N-acetylglucosamine deacetylase